MKQMTMTLLKNERRGMGYSISSPATCLSQLETTPKCCTDSFKFVVQTTVQPNVIFQARAKLLRISQYFGVRV